MTERDKPQARNRSDAVREHLSRRSFLRGVGALPMAALVPWEALFAKSLDTAGAATVAPKRSRVGALFNPYHRPEDWSLLARRRPEGMPLLGAYPSYAVGSVTTQIIWARMMGLDFFLAAYCPARSSQAGGLEALFEAAGRDGYRIGLYIDLQDNAGRPRQRAMQARLAAALKQVASRYLPHPAYLRDAHGLPVLGVAGLNDGSLLDAALAATGDPKAWGPVLRFPAAWRSIPDARVDPELAQAVDREGVYLGFSARNGGRAVSRVIPCHSRAASAVLVSPVRNETKGIQLPTEDPTNAAYIILDSFNNWGVSVPLEPGTRSRNRYVRHIAGWSRSSRT